MRQALVLLAICITLQGHSQATTLKVNVGDCYGNAEGSVSVYYNTTMIAQKGLVEGTATMELIGNVGFSRMIEPIVSVYPVPSADGRITFRLENLDRESTLLEFHNLLGQQLGSLYGEDRLSLPDVKGIVLYTIRDEMGIIRSGRLMINGQGMHIKVEYTYNLKEGRNHRKSGDDNYIVLYRDTEFKTLRQDTVTVPEGTHKDLSWVVCSQKVFIYQNPGGIDYTSDIQGEGSSTLSGSDNWSWYGGGQQAERHMFISFDDASLKPLGNKLSLTIKYKAGGSSAGINTGNDTPNAFRVGLFNNNGTEAFEGTGTSNPLFSGYTGYFGGFAVKASNKPEIFERQTGQNSLILGDIGQSLGQGSQSDDMANNEERILEFSLERMVHGIRTSMSQTGETAIFDFEGSDTSGTEQTFNTIAIGFEDIPELIDWCFIDYINLEYTNYAPIIDTNEEEVSQLNILLITADDMSYGSPGFTGGVAPDVTPNIDRLANESFSFEKAFASVAVCQPSRQSMLSGLYPHNYGSAGFFPMKDGVSTLPSLLRAAGYVTGNINKTGHMLPKESFNWTFEAGRSGYDDNGRDPEALAGALRRVIELAGEQKKPFFMVVNSSDPHRPFYGDDEEVDSQSKVPSRIYGPEEVSLPPTLPDLPGIRIDLAKYASSVRRLDDAVGECLKVLEEKQKVSSTLVIFTSDHGMPLPFGKFDSYLESDHTPLLFRWPEYIPEPVVDSLHLVSLMDLTPTILELGGLPVPDNLDGESLVPFLENRSPETWRESIVFLRNQDIYYRLGFSSPELISERESQGWVSRPDHPNEGTYSRDKEQRSYYDGQYGYIYNNCYREDGLEIGPLGVIVPYNGTSIRAMNEAAATDMSVKERYEFFLLRAPEELYDWSSDPGGWYNLAGDPEYSEVLQEARNGLLQWMKSSKDPLTEIYQNYVDSLFTK
ncbi:sulfatase [Bacteroidota bacterium]